MARPTGCSESLSSANAMLARSASLPLSGMRSVSVMRPLVSVPVLSSTTVSIRRERSSASPPRIRMPSCAPRPVPTRIAVGVANPSAHGHAMIKTATAATRPCVGLPASTHQARKVRIAAPITTGTKIALTRSTSFCTGAFSAWACSTRRAICASAVSAPIALARTLITPCWLIVAPATESPTCLSSGTDSPVKTDSSTAEAPSTITPSTGIRSPGRTRTTSPTITSSIATIVSTPSRSTRASFAPSASKARSALEARPRARASKKRPSKRNAMIAAEVS